MTRLIIPALVALLVSGSSWADSIPWKSTLSKRIPNAELISIFAVGSTFAGTTHTGVSYSVSFRKFNYMDGVAGASMDAGNWKVVNDTLCLKWEQWQGADTNCFHFERMDNGDYVSFFPSGDRAGIYHRSGGPKLTTIPTQTKSATTPTVKTSQPKDSVTVEERLAKLKKLLNKGLVTPDEAAEKRKEILKGL